MNVILDLTDANKSSVSTGIKEHVRDSMGSTESWESGPPRMETFHVITISRSGGRLLPIIFTCWSSMSNLLT